MLYSHSTYGFYSRDIHGDNIPADVVEISTERYTELLSGQSAGKTIVADNDGYPILVDREALPPQVPQKVTMRQARLALLQAGILSQVEDAINALPEPPRAAARIEWDFSSEVHRNKEFVAMMGQALNLSEEELDALFTLAATL